MNPRNWLRGLASLLLALGTLIALAKGGIAAEPAAAPLPAPPPSKPIAVMIGMSKLLEPMSKLERDIYYIAPRSIKEAYESLHVDPRRFCYVTSLTELELVAGCVGQFKDTLGKIDYLVATAMTEAAVEMAGALRSRFGIKNGLDRDGAMMFSDKHLMKRSLTAGDPMLATAAYLLLSAGNRLAIVTSLNFPLVAKPRRSLSSAGIHILADLEAFNEFCDSHAELLEEELPSYLVEEFIEGKILKIDGYVYKNELVVAFPATYEETCYEHFINGKPLVVSSDFSGSQQPQIIAFAAKVAKALGIQNEIFHLEVIAHDDEFYFLEIAVRPGGGSQTYERYGFSFSKAYLLNQLGLPAPYDSRKNARARDFILINYASLAKHSASKDQRVEAVCLHKPEDYPNLAEANFPILWEAIRIKEERTTARIAQFLFLGSKSVIQQEAQAFMANFTFSIVPLKKLKK